MVARAISRAEAARATVSTIVARSLGCFQGDGDIVQAIAGHRTPPQDSLPPLLAVVHLATVICSGLDLPFQPDSEVRHLAPQALRALGEDWEDKMPDLLGRVEVRFAQSRTLLK